MNYNLSDHEKKAITIHPKIRITNHSFTDYDDLKIKMAKYGNIKYAFFNNLYCYVQYWEPNSAVNALKNAPREITNVGGYPIVINIANESFKELERTTASPATTTTSPATTTTSPATTTTSPATTTTSPAIITTSPATTTTSPAITTTSPAITTTSLADITTPILPALNTTYPLRIEYSGALISCDKGNIFIYYDSSKTEVTIVDSNTKRKMEKRHKSDEV